MLIHNPRTIQFAWLQSFVTTQEISFDVIKMHQVHGDRVVIVTDPKQVVGDADGIVTKLKDVSLSVQIADCGNIYAYDPISHIVGICHSGWRSTHLNIIKNMINSMKELWSEANNIYIYTWPSICPSCHQFAKQTEWLFDDKYYEEVRDSETSPEWRNWEKLLNLRAVWKDQLLDAGLFDEHIVISDLCTMCESDLPSFKRDGTSERMVGVIGMK
jgi:YfiH family protein